jgi:hypothetical protein
LTFVSPVPPGYAVGDLLLAFTTQDSSTGLLSTPTSGWTALSPQVAIQSQKSRLYAKIAASTSEPDFTAESTFSAGWTTTMLVIKGNHATWQDGSTLSESLASTGSAHTFGNITTSHANSLVLRMAGIDSDQGVMPSPMHSLNYVAALRNGTVSQFVGYQVQATAGTCAGPTVATMNTRISHGISIAIRDDGSVSIPPVVKQFGTVLEYHGSFVVARNVTQTNLALIAATIDGISVWSNAPPVISTGSPVALANGYGRGAGVGGSISDAGANNTWIGGAQAIASTDMTGRFFSIEWGISSTSAAMGVGGFIVVFADAVGGWAAFRLGRSQGGVDLNSMLNTVIDLASPPIDGSGTINWAAVTRIGYAYHRGANTATRQMVVASLILYEKLIITDGSLADPITPAFISRVAGWWAICGSAVQGRGQAISKLPVQIGDGTTKTVFDLLGRSFEYPFNTGPSPRRRLWVGQDASLNYEIRASATDVVQLRGGVVSSEGRQLLTIASASSPSATYDCGGLSVEGAEFKNLASGVTVSGATFTRCRQIELVGALQDSAVVKSLVASAVITANPSLLTRVRFVQGTAGHAIEITSPGTYSFVGNTFTGYGANGSTDAAIYNNSGGAVTLNISGGGDTPTVRNGASASTTINNNVTIALTGLIVGSSIRVERVSDDALIEFRTAASASENFSVAGGAAYRVKVRKATSAPKYLPYVSQTGTLSADASIVVAQVADPIA